MDDSHRSVRAKYRRYEPLDGVIHKTLKGMQTHYYLWLRNFKTGLSGTGKWLGGKVLTEVCKGLELISSVMNYYAGQGDLPSQGYPMHAGNHTGMLGRCGGGNDWWATNSMRAWQ